MLSQRSGGEKLHNRYLLTEIGGVSLGLGLQETLERDHGETDDICRLSSTQHEMRWGQYVSARAFDLVADPIEIEATAKKE